MFCFVFFPAIISFMNTSTYPGCIRSILWLSLYIYIVVNMFSHNLKFLNNKQKKNLMENNEVVTLFSALCKTCIAHGWWVYYVDQK